MSRRRPGRQVALELYPAGQAARAADDTLRTLSRTLTTSVRVTDAGAGVPVQRVRHVNLQQLGALEISGSPMQVRNALSSPGAVFVLMLVDGDCALACEAGQTRLRAGQFTLLDGGRTMHATHAAPFLLRSMRLPAAQLEREMADWRSAELLPMDADSGAAQVVAQLQQTLLSAGAALTSRSADAYAQTVCCALADALRHALPQLPGDAGAQSLAEHHKRRIRSHVRQRLSDPQLDVAGIAAGVALSVGHVHRLFADEPESLAAWIQAERLDACRAALLAQQTSVAGVRSLTDLALSWGFREPTHFSRSFKRRFGMAPSTLRAQVLRGEATSQT